LGTTEFAATADDLEASMIRGTIMIAPKSRTAATRTTILIRIPNLLRVGNLKPNEDDLGGIPIGTRKARVKKEAGKADSR
jgi:hypothetical protein